MNIQELATLADFGLNVKVLPNKEMISKYYTDEEEEEKPKKNDEEEEKPVRRTRRTRT